MNKKIFKEQQLTLEPRCFLLLAVKKKDFKFFMIKTPTHAIGEKQSGFHLLQFFFEGLGRRPIVLVLKENAHHLYTH